MAMVPFCYFHSLQQLPFDDEGGRDDASSVAEAGEASLEESSISHSLLSRDHEIENQNNNPQQIVLVPVGVAEYDKTGDDSSMNSSQASINQEKISDLPSVASMRRKVCVDSSLISSYRARLLIHTYTYIKVYNYVLQIPQSLNSSFPRSLSAPAGIAAVSNEFQAEMT